jgi:hypothetical protein
MQNAQTGKEVTLSFLIMESISNLDLLCTYTHLTEFIHGKDFAKLRRVPRCLIELRRFRERGFKRSSGS